MIGPSLVVLHHPECGPSRSLLEGLKQADLPLKVQYVDIEADPRYALKLNLRGTPACVFVQDKKVRGVVIGDVGIEELKIWCNQINAEANSDA